MRSITIVSMLCALPILACDDDKSTAPDTTDIAGDTSAGDTSAGDTTPTPTGVEDQLAKAWCQHLERCYPFDSSEGLLVLLANRASETECETFVKRALLRPEGRDAGLAAGAYTVDAARLTACLAAIPTACGFDEPGIVCQEILEGKVALGGACTSSKDCAGDAFCDTSGCEGKCAARGGAGATCDTSDACSNASAHLECTYEGSTCVPVEIVEGAAKGAECGDLHATDKVTLVRCATPLACAEGTCQDVIPDGGTCASDHSPCARGTACMPDDGGTPPDGGGDVTGTCRVPPFADTEGSACQPDWEAPSPMFCDPVKLLACVNGKCQRIGDGTEGARCLAGQDTPALCNTGLYCDRATATCRPPQADGQTCESDDECVSGYCLYEADTAVCRPAPACR